jgi:hypothetical protein
VIAAEGAGAVKIISPEGDSWLDLTRACDRLSDRHHLRTRNYLKLPVGNWTSDLPTICRMACAVDEAFAFESWDGDTLTGGIDSREVKQAYMRVSNARELHGFEWWTDGSDKEWFKFECPASMKAVRYTCAVCMQARAVPHVPARAP